jgi:hypothetical protein
VLGPESGLFAQLDPVDFARSVLSALGRAAGHPDDVRDAWLRFATAMAGTWPAAAGHVRAGRLAAPPPMGSDRHPALGEAPGEYARG